MQVIIIVIVLYTQKLLNVHANTCIKIKQHQNMKITVLYRIGQIGLSTDRVGNALETNFNINYNQFFYRPTKTLEILEML